MLFINLKNKKNEKLSKEEVGGKAFSLMKLNDLEIKVPNGVVIPSFVCRDFKEGKVKIESLIKSLPKFQSEKLMIRSSAIGEDGADHSFAGQLESYQVQNTFESIKEGILDCWGAYTSKKVNVYQESQQVFLKGMAIIVQEMIEPDYSGVFFSAAPDDEDQFLVEYVEGHCEKLVQGEVTPVSIYSNDKSRKTPFSLEELSQLANKVVTFYQDHQDIEWLVKDDVFYFVQSRPITCTKKRIYWSSTNLNENYPNKISPLLYSIARKSYYHYFKNLCLKLKILNHGQSESDFSQAVGLWGHHIYYNMTHIQNVFKLSPISDKIENSFNDFVGYQSHKKMSTVSLKLLSNLKFLAMNLWHLMLLKKYVSDIEKRVDLFEKKILEKLNLTNMFYEFLYIRFHFWWRASFADYFSMLTHGILGHYLKFMKVEDYQGVQNSLIQSIPNLVSNTPIFKLWDIKCLLKKHDLIEILLEKNDDEFLAFIAQEIKFVDVKKEIDYYLQDWGYRCSGELTFLESNFIEKPEQFIRMLKSFVKGQDEDPRKKFKAKHKEQQNILKETKSGFVRQSVLFPIHQFFLTSLVKLTMFSISCRERVRLKQAKLYYYFKTLNLMIGDKFVEKKVLAKKQDIFYLKYNEISELLSQDYCDKEYISSLIKLRVQSFNEGEEAPENFYNFNGKMNNQIVDQDLVGGEGDLMGMPACGGIIEGRVVVIDSVTKINQLQKGDILVTKQTDPGWICAFPIISGIIVERGGMLSHGAIVAREFGIPAIVGVKNITQTLKTGDIVTLDGNKGCISV